MSLCHYFQSNCFPLRYSDTFYSMQYSAVKQPLQTYCSIHYTNLFQRLNINLKIFKNFLISLIKSFLTLTLQCLRVEMYSRGLQWYKPDPVIKSQYVYMDAAYLQFHLHSLRAFEITQWYLEATLSTYNNKC